MKKIVLLSGHSQRFLDRGYPIKPLIAIQGKTILDLAVQTIYEREVDYRDYVFVVKKTDTEKYNIDRMIIARFPGCDVSVINDHTMGPVYSVQQVYDKIPDSDEIIVAYCDLYINWNFSNFVNFARVNNCSGVIASHTGWHPHRIYNCSFAYMRTDQDNVLEIKEKSYFTNDPMNEPASSGIYYYKSGHILKKYLDELVSMGIRVNNEFYVTMAYNLLIRDALTVKHYTSNNYFCLGTPRDVEIVMGCLFLRENLKTEIVDFSRLMSYFTTEY